MRREDDLQLTFVGKRDWIDIYDGPEPKLDEEFCTGETNYEKDHSHANFIEGLFVDHKTGKKSSLSYIYSLIMEPAWNIYTLKHDELTKKIIKRDSREKLSDRNEVLKLSETYDTFVKMFHLKSTG